MQNNLPSKALRQEILEKALVATMGDREKSYGSPFPNMSCAAELKNVYKKFAGNKYNAAHEQAMDMVFTKLARIATGAVGHLDSYIDASAYIAIAAECQNIAEDRLAEMDRRYREVVGVVATDRGMKNPHRKPDAFKLPSYSGVSE